MQSNNHESNKQEQIKVVAYENRIDVEYIPPTISSQPSGDEGEEKKRVAPYCRVSTSSDDQLASYETQIQAYKDYVSKHDDWILVDICGQRHLCNISKKIEMILCA